MALTAEELLAGSSLTQEVEIPAELLRVSISTDAKIMLRPLTVRDLQLIGKASNGDDSLSAAMMIQKSLVDPELSLEEVTRLPAGLARFLVNRINEISGISIPRNALEEFVQAPLAKAFFVLAKEFGWTPEDVKDMTIGQILFYIEMARSKNPE